MKNKKNAKLPGAKVGDQFMNLGERILEANICPWRPVTSRRKLLAYNATIALGIHLTNVVARANAFTSKPTERSINGLLAELQALAVATAKNLTEEGTGEWEVK